MPLKLEVNYLDLVSCLILHSWIRYLFIHSVRIFI